jgi:hypothetical protein
MDDTPLPPPPAAIEANKLTLRAATKADLDDITDVVQAGFPDDPEWDYRFPYSEKYPEDNRKWTRREYDEYLEQPDKYAVLAATAPVETDGKTSSKVIALAVWDISVLTKSTGGGKQPSYNVSAGDENAHFTLWL